MRAIPLVLVIVVAALAGTGVAAAGETNLPWVIKNERLTSALYFFIVCNRWCSDIINNDMQDSHPYNPLHGITLKMIVEALVEKYGFPVLGQKIRIRCFTENPSVASSLTFLRKTPWAREKVEQLYIRSFRIPR